MQRFFRGSALAMLLLVTLTGAAFARPKLGPALSSRVTEFTVVDTPCEVVQEATVTVDESTGITYTDGQVVAGISTSDNPMVNGRSLIVMDTQTNGETEETKMWVTAFIYPDLIDGAFIAPGTTIEGTPNLLHRGHGTRELAGLRIRFEADVTAGVDLDPVELPCEPLFPPVVLTGVIVDLGHE